MLDTNKKLLFSIPISMLFIFIAFAILEVIWFGWISADWYQQEMQGLLRTEYKTWPWIVFYLMYASVILMLAVVPNREKPWFYTAISGGLLGLASYGAYNLTSYSVIEGFTLKIMIIDWLWGIFLTAVSATAGWIGFRVKS